MCCVACVCVRESVCGESCVACGVWRVVSSVWCVE